MLYIAILDSHHRSTPSHCRLFSLWLSEISRSPFIEGIEFYTNHSWINSHCGIRPFVVPSPPSLYPVHRESGCWVLLNLLKLFLSRSKSGYLFLIDDSGFIRPSLFTSWLKTFFGGFDRPPAIGFCYEIRDYFRLLMSGTGILVSRAIIERILKLEATWDVMCRCELTAEEALGHVMMEEGVWITERMKMLGKTFENESDYEALKTKDFSKLKECQKSGVKTRVCDDGITRFADLVGWNGVGEVIDGDLFLEKVEEMIKDVPEDVGIAWTKTSPWLCRIGKGSEVV